jgi:hypothetical protein
VPERSAFLGGESPGRGEGRRFPGRRPGAYRWQRPSYHGGAGPWVCDALQSNHSVKAYHRDLTDFIRRMQAQGATPLDVTAVHVKLAPPLAVP